MKSAALAVASLVCVIAPAHAAYDRYGNYYEPRPVVTAETREECWNTRNGRFESRPEASHRIGGGAAVGAIAGGVLGHQVGSGHGNDAATVGGALLGGLIGHKVEKDRREDKSTADFDMNRCRTVTASAGPFENQSYYDNRWR